MGGDGTRKQEKNMKTGLRREKNMETEHGNGTWKWNIKKKNRLK